MDIEVLKEYEREEARHNDLAKSANNKGLLFVILMLIPGIHYIGFIGICIFALKMLNHRKKACYYRGLIDGMNGLSKDEVLWQVGRLSE